MQLFNRVRAGNVERAELHLSIFTCLGIGAMTFGTALFMYPVVFSDQSDPNTLQSVAVFVYCGLSLIFAAYLWNRQAAIRSLRRQMAADRRRIVEAHGQASVELLKNVPNLKAFQERLPVEYAETMATTQRLSILVINLRLPSALSSTPEGAALLGDAAKVISRKLRGQDSIYTLGHACFGVVMPGVDMAVAERVSSRLAEGLAGAAGAGGRFTYHIDVVNYPTHGSTAQELQQAVTALIPATARASVRAAAEGASMAPPAALRKPVTT